MKNIKLQGKYYYMENKVLYFKKSYYLYLILNKFVF